jgi:hypothetical protein
VVSEGVPPPRGDPARNQLIGLLADAIITDPGAYAVLKGTGTVEELRALLAAVEVGLAGFVAREEYYVAV